MKRGCKLIKLSEISKRKKTVLMHLRKTVFANLSKRLNGLSYFKETEGGFQFKSTKKGIRKSL